MARSLDGPAELQSREPEATAAQGASKECAVSSLPTKLRRGEKARVGAPPVERHEKAGPAGAGAAAGPAEQQSPLSSSQHRASRSVTGSGHRDSRGAPPQLLWSVPTAPGAASPESRCQEALGGPRLRQVQEHP